ncbi:MAG: efflux RND transporter periplasmic adaptor subunit, partial [Chrysiogenales bacterium]
TIYKTEADALNKHREPMANAQAVVFTKEKSWKVDFSTELPLAGAFGQIIKTTAQIHSAQGDEAIITAKANGVIMFDGDVLEGKSLTSGQSLFMISAGGITENNLAVRFSEAQNNYQRAKAEYERSKDLAQDKIVAEKDFLKTKNEYDNAKLIFDNLNRNFSGGGQRAVTPFAGFIKQIFVNNGQFVNAGQPIVTVSQNRTLLLRADVQQKYAPVLASIVSATIRTLHDNQTYSLEQLNGKILSYGRNVNNDNYLIPISIQIENKGGLLSGGFVELYLKTMINANALSIPNTSILEEQGKYFIYLQVNPENFEKREVTLGASDGLRTEIITGIDRNDRFVSKGAIWVKLAQASGVLDAHSGHVH